MRDCAKAPVIGASALITGKFEIYTLNLGGFVGGQMFAYVQMGLLAQEASAARAQQRQRAAAAGWAGFVGAILLLAALNLVLAQQYLGWSHLILGHLIVAVMAMVLTVQLYAGRTDFTR